MTEETKKESKDKEALSDEKLEDVAGGNYPAADGIMKMTEDTNLLLQQKGSVKAR